MTTSFFTTSLRLLQQAGTGTNSSASNLSTSLFKLFKPLDTFSNLSISNLSKSDIKLAKSVFWATPDVPTPVAFSKSDFTGYLDKSNSDLTNCS